MRYLYLTPFGRFGTSHAGPFVPLARALRERGHEVEFLAPEPIPRLEALGFRSRSQDDFALPREKLNLLSPSRLLDGVWDQAFSNLGIDRFVVDATIGCFCLHLAKLEIPSIRFHVTLPLDDRPSAWSPPTCREQISGDGPVERARIRRQWRAVERPRRTEAFKDRVRDLIRPDPERPVSALTLHRRLAAAAGIPSRRVDPRALVPGFPWPEIVACDERFAEGYGPRTGRVFYGDQVVDWDPAGLGFDLGRLRDGAPLVYCSFGSNSGAWSNLEPVLEGLTDAARHLPEWDFVLAAAARWRGPLERRVPSNFHMVEFAPQMALLGRASVFVTHGGLSSVREARHHGVPSFLIPIEYEQFGNAARAVRLGMGRSAPLDALPSTEGWVESLRDLAGRAPEQRRRAESSRARAKVDLRRAVDLLEKPWSWPEIRRAYRGLARRRV